MNEKLMDIRDGIDKASESTTPFIVPGDELMVVGDANKTEINTHDFEITFRIPEKQEDGTVKQVMRTKEYKDVYITPRMDSQVVRMITKIMPYYRKQKPDGTVEPYTDAELAELFESFQGEIMDIMYQTVATVLKINPALADYMTEESVMNAAAKIIRQYPETVSEAETFFT